MAKVINNPDWIISLKIAYQLVIKSLTEPLDNTFN